MHANLSSSLPLYLGLAAPPDDETGSAPLLEPRLELRLAKPKHVRAKPETRKLAGVSLFYLARLLGSSVEQIDRAYGHMLPDSEEYLCGLLDSYDSTQTLADALEG